MIAGVSTNNSTGCMIIPAGTPQNIVVEEEEVYLVVVIITNLARCNIEFITIATQEMQLILVI